MKKETKKDLNLILKIVFIFLVFYYFATINEEQTDGGETKYKYEIQGKIQIKQPTVILRLLTHSLTQSFIHYFFRMQFLLATIKSSNYGFICGENIYGYCVH